MTLRFDLDFQFKGNRNYVHGTDMLNTITDVLSQRLPMPMKNMDIQIHRMTSSNLTLDLTQDRTAIAPTPENVATLSLTAGDVLWYGRLRERDARPVGRYPYDEDSLAAVCEFAASDTGRPSIVLRSPAPFTPIETFVAMTKALHLRALPDASGKWVFCRWVSARWPLALPAEDITVTLTQALGVRLTQSKISVGGELAGTVYFSASVNKH